VGKGSWCKEKIMCDVTMSAANLLNSPLAVMQNFAIFEWLLWQQGSLGGTFK